LSKIKKSKKLIRVIRIIKTRELRKYKRKNGICLWCPSPVVPGKSLCEKHLISSKKNRNRFRKGRFKLKKCCLCGSDIDFSKDKVSNQKSYYICNKCREKIRINDSRKICPDGVISEKGYIPIDYWSKGERIVLKNNIRNKCSSCGKPKDRIGTFCKKCLEKHNARERKRRALYAKKSLCCFCGYPVLDGKRTHPKGTCHMYKGVPKEFIK